MDSEKPSGSGKMFTLKKWNAVAMWSWDVECEVCAICRVQVMGECHLPKIDVVHLNLGLDLFLNNVQ